MKTLSIISHKGGAGKTSSAVMLAEEFARRGLRTVLIDADRQRGAGIILGIDQITGGVQQTRNPKLRYLCSSGIPLRDLRLRAEELSGLFDVAVVDTPSLDDPLARGWIQLSTDVLLVVPVEPVSLKTLESCDTLLDTIHRLNHDVTFAGTLPTIFDETDTTQRTLLLELQSRRPEDLLPPIPHDPGLAHRAEQKIERRTEPGEESRAAYAVTVDHLVGVLGLTPPHQSPAGNAWGARRAPATPTPAPAAGPVIVAGRRSPAVLWGGLALALVVVLGLVLGFLFRPARAGADQAPRPGRKNALVNPRTAECLVIRV